VKTNDSSLALAHGQRLAVETGNVLRLFAADGQTTLTVLITPAGPVLQFSGGLEIQAEGDLAVSGKRLALHGREGVAISTGGDLSLHADRDLHSLARIQNITADLGNVNVKANDDVRLNGERVMVNCD
jgi:uncharacterized protein (DUF2345 family)